MKKSVSLLLAACAWIQAGCSTSQPASMPAPKSESRVGGVPAEEHLLDHLTGKWVLTGTIAGSATTHDVEAEWVLNREYIRLHEVSRDLNATGGTAYEAIVFISWDPRAGEYACQWLDSTAGGGLSADAIAHGKPNGDSIPFLFQLAGGVKFHNTFIYSSSQDEWQWIMDGEEGGKLQPFARVKLVRK